MGFSPPSQVAAASGGGGQYPADPEGAPAAGGLPGGVPGLGRVSSAGPEAGQGNDERPVGDAEDCGDTAPGLRPGETALQALLSAGGWLLPGHSGSPGKGGTHPADGGTGRRARGLPVIPSAFSGADPPIPALPADLSCTAGRGAYLRLSPA